jgi:hypothetical protein
MTILNKIWEWYLYHVLFPVFISRFVKSKYSNLYKRGRRVGNTTRLIDFYIQDFFTKGKCVVIDHYDTQESHKRIFDLVLRRLRIEHNIQVCDLFLDKNRHAIRLKDNYKKDI